MASNAVMVEVQAKKLALEKLTSELRGILKSESGRPPEYDICDVFDILANQPIKDSDFNNIIAAIKLLETNSISFINHQLTPAQQATLVATLPQVQGLDSLVFNGFQWTAAMIQSLSSCPHLLNLFICNLSVCQAATKLNFAQLAQTPSLIKLCIRYQPYDVRFSSYSRNEVEQEQPARSSGASLITTEDVFALMKAETLLELDLPDAALMQKDVAALTQDLENKSNIEYLCLPNTIKIDQEQLTACVKRHKANRFPSDKIRLVSKTNGQKVMYFCNVLLKKIDDLFEQKSGDELKKILLSLGLDPNGYHWANECNPVFHCWVANENHTVATRLIEVFPEEFDPNLCDWERKTALIIAAKAYSADREFAALLKMKHKVKNFNARDRYGCTALHYLCAYGKTDFVMALLKAGADSRMLDENGKTPFDYIDKLSDLEFKTILQDIVITPERDSNAVRCNLFANLNIYVEGFSKFPVANMKTLESLITFIQSDKFTSANEYYGNKSSIGPIITDRKILVERCEKLKQTFSGKNIVEASMEARKTLLTTLQKAGYLSHNKSEAQDKSEAQAVLLMQSQSKAAEDKKTVAAAAAATAISIGIPISRAPLAKDAATLSEATTASAAALGTAPHPKATANAPLPPILFQAVEHLKPSKVADDYPEGAEGTITSSVVKNNQTPTS